MNGIKKGQSTREKNPQVPVPFSSMDVSPTKMISLAKALLQPYRYDYRQDTSPHRSFLSAPPYALLLLLPITIIILTSCHPKSTL
jgi:hypothetical protein